MSDKQSVKNLQTEIRNNRDLRTSFVENNVSDSDQSPSEVKLTLPRKKYDASSLLVTQLCAQQAENSKLLTRLSEVTNELTRLETTSRYATLELSNVNLNLDEIKKDFMIQKTLANRFMIETYSLRLFIGVCVCKYFYNLF